ncbi:hypothetical protein E2C01_036327 [Portunus trituberculatus]|uniref:Uncharacterized protein n=1 Tax=Portunus trituberculatus TaxID=210409 RepID=A0A5B7F5I2_PORTR|nr:hypothetical protein [Portunus trituberculatus]
MVHVKTEYVNRRKQHHSRCEGDEVCIVKAAGVLRFLLVAKAVKLGKFVDLFWSGCVFLENGCDFREHYLMPPCEIP